VGITLLVPMINCSLSTLEFGYLRFNFTHKPKISVWFAAVDEVFAQDDSVKEQFREQDYKVEMQARKLKQLG
jgi:hypothetical protein